MTQTAITSQAPLEMATDEQIGQTKALLDSIFRKLTKQQLQVIIGAGGQLQSGTRTVVQGLLAKLAKVFMVTINYARNLGDMIKAGNYGYVNENITAENFPITGEGQVDEEITLIHFNRNISSDDAIKEMDELGFKPAILPQLLAFGETHPEVQREFPIVALGSVACVDGERQVPYLDYWYGKRKLDLRWFDGDWGGNYRFADVRK